MATRAVSVKPAEGKLVVQFIDGEDDESKPPTADGGPEPNIGSEAVLAIVVAVGAKVPGVSKGDTVAMRPWSRGGVRLGNLVFCDAYDVLATIAD